jgi:hypothetical protein
MEAPAVTWTEAQTRLLLFRQGMFLFEKTEGAYTLVHRSSAGAVVRTAVEVTADGNYRIIRPSWPTISGVPFASVEALSKALKSIGLSLQSRIPE